MYSRTIEGPSFPTSTAETEHATVIINPPKRQPTWTGFHAPAVVESRFARMTTCADVREIYSQCLAQHSTDDMCKLAASYMSICNIRTMGNNADE